MAQQATMQELAKHRQPPFRAVIVIHLRRLAQTMRIPREGTAVHNELVRTFGERSWNDEHLFAIMRRLGSGMYSDQVLTSDLIADVAQATLPKGANPSLGCMDCQESGWRQIKARGGFTGVVRCECITRGKQAELAFAS